MQLLDHTCPAPQQNLALEEALLLAAEDGTVGEVLRLWESADHFVVLGAGGAVEKEANREACERDGVAILRRCSGGGTVLQGPGCLNYTLLLDGEERAELRSIDSTNAAVLASVREALYETGISARQDGLSDLVIEGLKFSGNAQRRRKRWILFHGTILHGFDLALIGRYLREPEKQPDYRGQRLHAEFVRNVPVDVEEFKAALARQWNAQRVLVEWPEVEMRRLVAEKYSKASWNEAF